MLVTFLESSLVFLRIIYSYFLPQTVQICFSLSFLSLVMSSMTLTILEFKKAGIEPRICKKGANSAHNYSTTWAQIWSYFVCMLSEKNTEVRVWIPNGCFLFLSSASLIKYLKEMQPFFNSDLTWKGMLSLVHKQAYGALSIGKKYSNKYLPP